jgi:hypothetical protein
VLSATIPNGCIRLHPQDKAGVSQLAHLLNIGCAEARRLGRSVPQPLRITVSGLQHIFADDDTDFAELASSK